MDAAAAAENVRRLRDSAASSTSSHSGIFHLYRVLFIIHYLRTEFNYIFIAIFSRGFLIHFV